MNPISMKVAAIAAGIALLIMAALMTWGLYWRGEYREAKAQVTVYAAQAKVNADAVTSCNAGVDVAKGAAEKALATGQQLLAEARKASGDRKASAKVLEEIARTPRAPGEDCNWAWDQVEKDKRRARDPGAPKPPARAAP